ncbi:MAG TPA: IS1182 family transposase [Anaeromyxobacter sp.]|nr:IS1182 family transposase [Anaeromyxobacter sp.]
MSKTFRPWLVEQAWLLPPSVRELVPAGDPAHFVRDLVRDELDLSAIVDSYDEERGFPPYHPVMMTALLLYAYTQGIYSSRRIARGCQTRVDFMAVTAMQQPDHRTVCDFRKRHLGALGDLFGQVLKLCQRAGMVKLGHVALDGTKINANASKRKAMSYARMKKSEQELETIVAEWLAKADAIDEAEDREFGADRRGDELPEWVKDKAKRLEVIRAAKAELEAEAKAALAAPKPDPDDPDPNKPRRRRKRRNTPKANGEPNDKAQLNFTDPDSTILKTSDGYLQGYNCQLAVDGKEQVIVAHALVNEQNDALQLPSMLEAIRRNTGRQAKEVSADTGYLSTENLRELKRRRIRGYIATARQARGPARSAAPAAKNPLAREMAAKLKRGGHRSRYRLRKQIVEPAIGQIKEARGFRRFLLRGLDKVPREWALVCTAHNLVKLAKKVA